LVIWIVCFASIALADDFKTNDGKEYKNVTVSRVEPDGIVLITSSGVSKVYFTELPKEVQERFNYDAGKPPHTPPSKPQMARLFSSSYRNRNNNESKRERSIGANIQLRHPNAISYLPSEAHWIETPAQNRNNLRTALSFRSISRYGNH